VPGRGAPQQLAQLGRVAERVGDDLAGDEGDRGVDPRLPRRDEVGARGEGAGVELRHALELGGVTRGGGSEGDGLHRGQIVASSGDLRKMLL
jgi:hypothetical protein